MRSLFAAAGGCGIKAQLTDPRELIIKALSGEWQPLLPAWGCGLQSVVANPRLAELRSDWLLGALL